MFVASDFVEGSSSVRFLLGEKYGKLSVTAGLIHSQKAIGFSVFGIEIEHGKTIFPTKQR
jgi:hypothetical protein